MTEVIPGILEKDWDEIEKKLKKVQRLTKWVHIDFIDGKFAENATFMDPAPFKEYSHSLFLEAHLMVEEPEQYIEPLAKAGFRRFIGHIEKMNDQAAFVARGEMWGEVGLALDAQSQVDDIKVSFDDLDFITIMTIQAGFSGQHFKVEHLEKCAQIRKISTIPLEVDGGINKETGALARASGVDRFVENSALFHAHDLEKEYKELLLAIDGNQNA